jgi:hypothetical protein
VSADLLIAAGRAHDFTGSGAKRRQENPKNRDDNRDGEDGGPKSARRPLLIHSCRLWRLRAERKLSNGLSRLNAALT